MAAHSSYRYDGKVDGVYVVVGFIAMERIWQIVTAHVTEEEAHEQVARLTRELEGN